MVNMTVQTIYPLDRNHNYVHMYGGSPSFHNSTTNCAVIGRSNEETRDLLGVCRVAAVQSQLNGTKY